MKFIAASAEPTPTELYTHILPYTHRDMDFTWKPIMPAPVRRAFPATYPAAAHSIVSLSQTASVCASTQPATPPQPSHSPESGLRTPTKPSAAASTHLLDLPVHLLHRILLLTQPARPRLPVSLLALASVCRHLRRVTATLLPCDQLWTQSESYSRQHPLPTCPHLSSNPCDPYLPPHPHQHCPNPLCAPLHRQLAWYSLSAPALRSLSLAHLLRVFPTREAQLLLSRLCSARPFLHHINLDLDLDHLENAAPHINTLLPTVRRLFATVSSHVQVIELCITDTRLYDKILAAVLSQPLPAVEMLSFSLPQVSDSSWEAHVRQVSNVLTHCLASSARVKTVQFDVAPRFVRALHVFAPLCPFVDDVLVKGTMTEKRSVSKTVGLSRFNAKQVLLEGLQLNDNDLSRFLEQTSVGADRLQSLGFVNCGMQGLWLLMRKKKGLGLERLVTRLEMGEKLDADTIELIGKICTRLEMFSVWCVGESVGKVSEVIQRLKWLKGMKVKVLGASDHDVDLLTDGIETWTSELEIFQVEGMMMKVGSVCEILHKFEKSLRKFGMQMDGKGFGVNEVECLFRWIVKIGGLETLECLEIRLQDSSTQCGDVEEDVMRDQVRKLMEEVRNCCPRLDLSSYEDWIND